MAWIDVPRQKKLLDFLAEGHFMSRALKASGISSASFQRQRKAYREGDDTYGAFFLAVEMAEFAAERKALASIMEGDKSWTARAWFLERRFKHWRLFHHLKTEALERATNAARERADSERPVETEAAAIALKAALAHLKKQGAM